MKKIFLLLTVFSMVFTSCDPLEDINAEVDAQANPIVGDAEYTLTGDDYDELDLQYGSFNSEDDAKALIPELLTEMYPAWGNKSSVSVGYKLYVGNAFGVKDYYLDQDDYTFSGSDLLGFEADAVPSNYLADILANSAGSASEGDYIVAKYSQYTGSAYVVTPTVSLEENLDYGAISASLTTISSDSWVNHSGAGNELAYSTESLTMDDYPSSNVGGSIVLSNSGSEDVNTNITSIITSGIVYSSALMNFSEVGDGTYFFHLMEEDGSFNYSARLGAKSDGSGNILFGIGASSSTLTYGTTSFNLNTTYLIVTSYDTATGVSNLYVLTSALDSKPATPEATSTGNSGNSAQRIGIRQGGGGPSVIIDGIRVANSWSAIMSNDDLDDEVIGDKIDLEAGYTYNGEAWVTPTDRFYLISDEDFDSMGEASGQPGRYNNFGSSTPAEDYLPTFLGIKFPYALEGQELDVVYDYFSSSSGAQVRGNLYTVIDGKWVGYESTIDTTLQFGHDGTTWVPDNTIKYTLIRNGDYEYMASQLTEPEYAGLIGNLASYGDFDYNWSDDQIHYALKLFLDHLDPDAAEGQKYILTYVIYDNGESDYQTGFKKEGGVWVLN
ncbi:hypothetical protein FPF71_17255 [Algibacter amylolyticus]|uniref:DUF5017 domain-containing protein n=1 Tax=Algibacter amylolyticus TaxID=1608400 RepID=A0A5M7AY23_9FLAO|nr:hypothetical protein [Algibacter amylolyticus]KAA5820887.1 hypothetical protein F2B50_17255 [Algibacter amylolyticus]MBB5269869.1 hypothetical protein [Algibacter amylolyticus]TSJ71962.1 hypothetical protein FPF71_17255 [Algibacter amylolyticus]